MAQIQRTGIRRCAMLRDMTFGKRLAEACALAGLTQDEIGNLLGRDQTTINKWMRKGINPRGMVDVANRASQELEARGVSVSALWLLTGEGPGPARPSWSDATAVVNPLATEINEAADAREDYNMQTEVAMMTELIRRLDPTRRAALQRYAWRLFDDMRSKEATDHQGPTRVRG